MTDLEKAARQALVALEKIASYRPLTFAECSDAEAVMGIAEKAIPALREALAEQPAQQEPVAWATQLNEYAHIKWGAKRPEYPMVYEFPLYTSPPAQRTWVGLTDEQFQTIKESLFRQQGWDGEGWDLALKEAIEAKLKEKNT